jgi:hypothetical protein
LLQSISLYSSTQSPNQGKCGDEAKHVKTNNLFVVILLCCFTRILLIPGQMHRYICVGDRVTLVSGSDQFHDAAAASPGAGGFSFGAGPAAGSPSPAGAAVAVGTPAAASPGAGGFSFGAGPAAGSPSPAGAAFAVGTPAAASPGAGGFSFGAGPAAGSPSPAGAAVAVGAPAAAAKPTAVRYSFLVYIFVLLISVQSFFLMYISF